MATARTRVVVCIRVKGCILAILVTWSEGCILAILVTWSEGCILAILVTWSEGVHSSCTSHLE